MAHRISSNHGNLTAFWGLIYNQPPGTQTANANWLTHLPLEKMAAILADNIFKRVFLNENVRILIQISLKFVPEGSIDNKPASVQVMAWRHTDNKPLPEPMLTQICVAIWRH